MHFQDAVCIQPFHLFQDIDKPFKVFMCWADPEEVNLLASNIAVVIAVLLFDQIHQSWSVGSDSNPATNHHNDIIWLPFLEYRRFEYGDPLNNRPDFQHQKDLKHTTIDFKHPTKLDQIEHNFLGVRLKTVEIKAKPTLDVYGGEWHSIWTSFNNFVS